MIGWWITVIVLIVSLAITLYLFLRSQGLLGRYSLTLSGLDWKSLRVFCLTSKHLGHQFMASLNSWSTDADNGPDFNTFVTESSFGILVRDIAIEWRLLKFTIKVKSISIILSPKPSFDLVHIVQFSDSPKGVTSSALFTHFIRWITQGILNCMRLIFCVEIEEFSVLFTSVPKSIPKVDFWIGQELCLRAINLFSLSSREDRTSRKVHWLKVDDVHAKQVSVRSADGLVTDIKQILSLPKLSVFQHHVAGILETNISFGILKVDLWPSSLLLYTSTFLKKSAGIQRPTENIENSWDDALEAWKDVLFPNNHLFAVCSESIQLQLHLPVSKVEMTRFESISFTIDSPKAFAFMNTAKALPLFLILSPKFQMSSKGADVVGPDYISRLQELFEGSLPTLNGAVQDLLEGFRASLSNCWPIGETLDAIDSLSDETITSWTRRVLEGIPAWGIQVNAGYSDAVSKDYESISQTCMKVPQSLFSATFDESSNPFTLRDYRILPKTILLRLQHLSFDVPFEFPLANLFDHLSYFIKSLKAPVPKDHDRQDFDFFNWTWRLVVVGEHGRFSVADGPFEAKLNRIFSKRKSLHDRFRKLEQAFWSRSEKVKNENVLENVNLNRSLIAFVESSLNPDLLKKSSYLISCYQRFHQVLFDLYHEQMKLADAEHLPALLSVSGGQISFCIRWNPSYLNGEPMSNLLNAIELSEKSFRPDIVADFGMFLGGFVDLFGQDLTVKLRDYALPLLKAHNIRINGLFFAIEEPSYPNGMATSFIPIVGHGSSNLRGVGIDGRVLVKRTILPVKLYHSLGISFFGEDCAIASFSLRYESAFQMLDRAFELFSKPPQEPSPHLPFWDKLRLLLRGALTAAHVSCPARVVWIAGKDLHSANESLELVFPRGFRIGLLSAEIRLRVPEAAIFMNSAQESILRWLHYTTGSAFHKTECALMGWSPELIGDIPTIQFPQCQFDLHFEISGLGGKPIIPHNAVRLCVSNRVPRSRRRSLSMPASPTVHERESPFPTDSPKDVDALDEPYDSYKYFRIHSMGMILHVTAPQCQDQARLFWYYYREVEDWIRRNLRDNFCAPVKPGRLFQFATLSRRATPKLSSVLSEFRFSLNYDGFFCARLLQYYDASQFGGVLICSEGRTRIWLNYKRSEQRSPQNRNYGRWFGHFMEVDFSNVRLAVITSDTNAENNLRTSGLPFSYEGVAIFTILTAPRLFWIAVNEEAFKHDTLGKAVQRKCLESRVSELSEEIDRLTSDLRTIDPNVDTNKFANCRREVSVLIEQQTHLKSFLASTDEANSSPCRGINNHQYIIQNAHLVWHQDVRDAVFALVDQQFQFFRLTKCLETDIWRTLKDFGVDAAAPVLSATSPLASGIRSRPIFMESPGTFTECILNSHSPFEAKPEGPDEDAAGFEFVHRDMPEPIQLAESGLHVATKVDFTLVNPQMVLLDTSSSGKVAAAITMVAKNASVNYGTLFECEGGQRVGRRTKISLEQAEVHVAFRSEFNESEWPPHFPPEYLLSRETEESRFHRISSRLRLTILYDVANPEYAWRQATSPIRRLFPAPGDRIVAESSGIEVLTTSEQFAVFYDILVKLLVYRDPTQKMRHEQLESIMLATNIFDSEQILARVKQNQETVWRLKQSVTRRLAKALGQSSYLDTVKLYQAYAALKMPWDSLALIVDALRTVRNNQEKLRQRQTRLLLEVLIGKIQWSLLQGNGTDALAELILHRNRVDWLSSEDGSQSLLMEIQTILALNRLPKAFYHTLIAPVLPEQLSQLKTAKEGFRGIGTLNNSLRFYVKMLPPVGGIRIIEHAELNLAPLHLQLTYNIAEELIKFFFPEKKPETSKSSPDVAVAIDERKRLIPKVRPSVLAKTFSSPDLRLPPSSRDDKASIKSDDHAPSTAYNTSSGALPRSSSYLTMSTNNHQQSMAKNTLDAALMMESEEEERGRAEMVIRGLTSSISTTASSFFSHFSHQPIDDHDVELMKSRASDNYSFIYVTVPASQHLISYKGKWDNSITDVENFVLKLPDFEYHSQIWSWLELALQLRRDSVGVVVNNVGALLKDKLRRLGQANKPEIDIEEETEGTSSSVVIGGLSRAVSRLRRSRRPTTEETPEDQDAKARLVLGRSYIKPD